MKLSDQVCSLAQAKHLKALGITARSLFTHIELCGDGNSHCVNTDSGIHDEYLPAFNVAELGVMLPQMCESAWSQVREGAPAWSARLQWETPINGFTEAEARAMLLIQLLKSGKVKAEEVNGRLAA